MLCGARLLLFTLLLVNPISASAAVLYVRVAGSDQNDGASWQTARRTITGALSTASEGDRIWIAAGTYTERIILKNGIALYGGFPESGGDWESRDPASNTTAIDGAQSGPVVTFAYGADRSTRIDGFMITGGRADTGAGVYCFGCSPTISGNRIVSNAALGYNGYGGGVSCENASPAITGNTIQANTALVGGAIYCASDSHPTISSNTIIGNSASEGGGIYCGDYCSPTISGNIITASGSGVYCEWQARPHLSGNTITGCAAVSGAGLYSLHSMPDVQGNTFAGNAASDSGGAIYSDVSAMLISGNRLMGNTALWGAAACCTNGSTDQLCNNLVAQNTAGYGAGGILCSYASPALIDNTIAGNTAPSYGAGVTLFGSSSALTNNVIAFNSSGVYRDPTTSVFPSQTTNCVYGNASYDYNGLPRGATDVVEDPLFVDRARDDYHPQAQSPCINAGSVPASGLPAQDIDGLPRVWAGAVDIGAYEFAAAPCAVSGARAQPDRTWLAVSGVVSGAFEGFFYLQEPSGIGGIRADWAGPIPLEGEDVTVYGRMFGTTSGERCIEVSTIVTSGH